jgi:hypothetical protein
MLLEMSKFVESDGVGAWVGGMRLEEFGFYAADSFKNLESAPPELGRIGCTRKAIFPAAELSSFADARRAAG